MSPFLPVAVALVVALISAPALIVNFNEGYDNVDRLASVKCLGCLGLDPVVPGFESFWTVYPKGHKDADNKLDEGRNVSHPELVRNITEIEGNILVLFFWTQGCVPCAAQWKAMEENSIASGKEDGGREGSRYSSLTMYSLDASITNRIELEFNGTVYSSAPNDLYWTYHYNGDRAQNGVPATVFIFQKDGVVNWFTFYGKMEIGQFEGMMTNILYHEIAHSS